MDQRQTPPPKRMTGLVKTLSKRIASFSNLRSAANSPTSSGTDSPKKERQEQKQASDTELTINPDIDMKTVLLTPPPSVAAHFDFGNMMKGIKRKCSLRGSSLRSVSHSSDPHTAMTEETIDTEATSPDVSMAHSEPPPRTTPTDVWDVLQGGKLSDRSPAELAEITRCHLIDVEIDNVNPQQLLTSLKELSVISCTQQNFSAMTPLFPQLTNLWICDYLDTTSSQTHHYNSVPHFQRQFQKFLPQFVITPENTLTSYSLQNVQFTTQDFQGHFKFIHKLSNISFPAQIHTPKTLFHRPFVLQITTIPRNFLGNGDASDQPCIEDIHAPALRELQIHAIALFPKIRRLFFPELREVTLTLSTVGGVDFFEEMSLEDYDWLMGVDLVKFNCDLKLLHRFEPLLRETDGGLAFQIDDFADEDRLKEMRFDKCEKLVVYTRLGRVPKLYAPRVKSFAIIYVNPQENNVTITELSTLFPLLQHLEIRSEDSKELAAKEPPLVKLQWSDRGLFNNLETIHMSSRVRLDTGFFTHAFPTLKKAKVTTLASVMTHGLSQWRTPLLEELELYVDFSPQVGELGDVAVVVSGYRRLRELYVRGITHLIVENCPYLELINSRYACPMKMINVQGSFILRGLVYDSPGGDIVDNVKHQCDRFVREYKTPPKNYHLSVYDSFLKSEQGKQEAQQT